MNQPTQELHLARPLRPRMSAPPWFVSGTTGRPRRHGTAHSTWGRNILGGERPPTGRAAIPFKRGHLRYLVATADEGQLTRAAAKLGISRTALSQAMSQLEAEVGFQLLERRARGVALTPAGEIFLERARLALDAASDASLAAQSLARVAQGKIEFGFVGAPPGFDSPGRSRASARSTPRSTSATTNSPSRDPRRRAGWRRWTSRSRICLPRRERVDAARARRAAGGARSERAPAG